jgi:hypothetical protein
MNLLRMKVKMNRCKSCEDRNWDWELRCFVDRPCCKDTTETYNNLDNFQNCFTTITQFTFSGEGENTSSISTILSHSFFYTHTRTHTHSHTHILFRKQKLSGSYMFKRFQSTEQLSSIIAYLNATVASRPKISEKKLSWECFNFTLQRTHPFLNKKCIYFQK